MKIIIAGGNGFLGKSLEHFFELQGHSVNILTRNPNEPNNILWDAQNLGSWKEALEDTDVLINMVGKSVDCSYTAKNKKEILESRINSTRVLQQAIDVCKNPPKTWLNASSATIYVHSENELMTETTGIIGNDFSMNICKEWEKEFFQNPSQSTRKVALRTSIVLGNNGGAFPKLKLVTKLGLGGKQGNGRQRVSWIHIEDFCRAVDFIISNEDINGAINVTAPVPTTNAEMMNALRKKYNAPFGLPSPKFLLEIASFFLRTETELLLKSRNVYPERLLEYGFDFKYQNFEKAVQNLD